MTRCPICLMYYNEWSRHRDEMHATKERSNILLRIQRDMICCGELPERRYGISDAATMNRMIAVLEKNKNGPRWRAIKQIYKQARRERRLA